MTDLERAYALVHSDPERIETALAAARREGAAQALQDAEATMRGIQEQFKRAGAAEMRERAAREARYWTASQKVADRILALPLTPEEPT